MANILILNGSPRAPKSNSRRYAEIVSKYCSGKPAYFNISRTNHAALCEQVDGCSELVFVFPLYADSIPVTLLNFLKSLEQHPLRNKPTVSVLINCGFLEPFQNDVAVSMMQLFCQQNGYPFGSVLKIASGEAILDTPFKLLVSRKIRLFARSIERARYRVYQTTMPLPKKVFIRASTAYWTEYGRKNGVTPQQMRSMNIEE